MGDEPVQPAAPRRPSGATLGVGAGLCLVAAGWTIGLRPLTDNSFLTHLATGRLILDSGSVPSTDPYTFTAAGEPWVVQSWLASVLYATLEALGGDAAVRLLMGVVAATLTALGWRLTRAAESLVPRLGLGVLFVAASTELWAERPFMLGLVALALVVLVGEGAGSSRWLVPLGWLWANVHGSFPLGIAYLLVVAVGTRLDGLDPRPTLRAAGWLGVGIVLGVIGPLGPRLLLFPVELVQQQDVLRNVNEWRAPSFDTFSQRAFVVHLALAVVLLVRRPSYRHGLVLAAFGALALIGLRNLPIAALVLLPGMAAGVPDWGSLRSGQRGPVSRIVVATGAAAVVLLGAVRLGQPGFELRRYPIDALAFLEESRVSLEEHRLAAPDVAGNVVELIYGPGRRVFYDDRFDMFPKDVSAANLELVRTAPGVRDALDDHEIDLVAWGRQTSTGVWLAADPDWRVLYIDERWIVACRRGGDVGGTIGRC